MAKLDLCNIEEVEIAIFCHSMKHPLFSVCVCISFILCDVISCLCVWLVLTLCMKAVCSPSPFSCAMSLLMYW